MTLIALTLNHGNPILMADVLFSSLEGDGNLAVPTFAKGIGEVLKVKEGYRPFSLRQKIYVIHDRLCVALGGGHDQMLTFYNRLKAFIPTNDFTEDEMEDHLKNYPSDLMDNLSAIVLACVKVDGETKFKVWRVGDVKTSDDELYGKIFAAGTGTQQFLHHIAETKVYEVDDSPDAPLINNLSLIGYWIGSDYISPDTLRNHWGAGYELIIFKDNKFVKLDEYVVVVLYAEIGEDIEFVSRPINTIMSNYQHDDLIIRSFSFNEEYI